MTTTRSCVFYDHRRRERCTECGQTLDFCKCENPDELAQERFSDDANEFFRQVQAYQENVQDRLFEELVAEIGDLGMHLAQHDQLRSPSIDVIRRSAIRAAAILAKLAVDGTPEYAYPAG